MIQKYGFVYIWFDTKKKKYYVGSHWGHVDDGYICSSSWMKQAYKKRSHNFKRKILKITENKKDLVDLEHHYLVMIKKEELGKKYYNLTNHKNGHWAYNDENLTVSEKISKANKGKKRKPLSAETKAKISDTRKSMMTDEYRQKMSEFAKGRTWKLSEEAKKNIGNGSKGRTWKISDEARQKMSERRKGRIPWNKGKSKKDLI